MTSFANETPSGIVAGRVVMLVDNIIDGDSRVQKAAKSMADAGWEVHLIGRSPTGEVETYALGAAVAHRMPLDPAMPRKTLRQRVARVKFPLAWKANKLAELHELRCENELNELWQRRFEPQVKRARGRGPLLGPLPAWIYRHRIRLRRAFVRVRANQTRRAAGWQKNQPHGRIERIEAKLWTTLLGHRAWRRLDPQPLRYESSYAGLIDELAPDLLHAHDFRMIGVAARAVARARAGGRQVRMVYDAHEFVPGLVSHGRKWIAAQIAYEREYIAYADAIATVSPALADMLVETHGLTERPIVTLNAPPRSDLDDPDRDWATEEGHRDVRAACGIGPDEPLMVYCGVASAPRGLHTMVETLGELDTLHVAFVVNRLDGDYIDGLWELARERGAEDRLHVMPYVPYDELAGFLSTADVGVHPLSKGQINHEVALSTKFFEFMQARLPVIVSNVKAMSDQVRARGIGEVFNAEDAHDLARALKTVLADPDGYTRPYKEPGFLDAMTWEAQAEHYAELYRRLLAD